MKEDIAKHLEFIQTIIARMAGHCFVLKGWTVTLSAAFFAVAAKDWNPAFAMVALFPAFSFWGLDAYYLRQERLFRKLYDEIRGTSQTVDAFSLSTSKYTTEVPSWLCTLWSPSVIGLHGPVIGVVLAMILIFS